MSMVFTEISPSSFDLLILYYPGALFLFLPFPFLLFSSPSPCLPLPPLLPAPSFLLFLQYWTRNPGFRTVGKHSTTELHAPFLSSSLFCSGWNSGLCAFQANTLPLSYISCSLLRILGRCSTIKPRPHKPISLGRYGSVYSWATPIAPHWGIAGRCSMAEPCSQTLTGGLWASYCWTTSWAWVFLEYSY